MRAVAVLALSIAVSASGAGAVTIDRQDTGASAGIIGGTPVAVAVRGADGGELGGYTTRGGRSGPRWTCGYFPLTGGTNLPGIAYDRPVTPVAGEGYAFLCHDQAGQLVHSRVLRYQPGDPLGGLFAAERAAELAVEQLELPDPTVGLSPPGSQLVGVPTWLWVGDWAIRSTSASVSGVTATVTARPAGTTWDLGDGARKACDGPGTAYDPDRSPDAQASSCTHTFVWPSSHPRGARQVTATVTYAVAWAATTGAGGDLGTVTRSTTVPVDVVEVQAVGR